MVSTNEKQSVSRQTIRLDVGDRKPERWVPTDLAAGQGLAPGGGPGILINIDELAARLAVAKSTLYNWVYLRRIPYIKAGRCLRFDPQAVFNSLRHLPTMEVAGRR
jgi:excisionase family DNA binding protein